jgi:nicotinamidase/pyrazinamidase
VKLLRTILHVARAAAGAHRAVWSVVRWYVRCSSGWMLFATADAETPMTRVGHRSVVMPSSAFEPTDVLLVIDVQRDFCAGGALAVPDADAVVPVLNRWLAAAARRAIPIFASRDWHPRGHISFRARGGPWPAHCVQDTRGARFHRALRLPPSVRVVTKGVRFDRDQLSAFDATGLAVELQRLGTRRLWVGGLAADVCVRATVLDAVREHFAVRVIADGTRPVDPRAGAEAIDDMRAAGAAIEEAA